MPPYGLARISYGMSTHALSTTDPSMGLRILRNLDLIVLAVALPVFIAAELPLLGWAAATVAWVASRVRAGARRAPRRRVRRPPRGDGRPRGHAHGPPLPRGPDRARGRHRRARGRAWPPGSSRCSSSRSTSPRSSSSSRSRRRSDEDRATKVLIGLFGFFTLFVDPARDLRLRRQERRVPAAGGVPPHAVDRDRPLRHRHVDQPRGLLPLPRRRG